MKTFKKAHIPEFSYSLYKILRHPLLIYFTLAGNFITFSSAYIFYLFEKKTNSMVNGFFDAIWWAFCTISTVGYGDIFPITVGGRMVGIFLILTGILFFISFISVLVSLMHESFKESEKID